MIFSKNKKVFEINNLISSYFIDLFFWVRNFGTLELIFVNPLIKIGPHLPFPIFPTLVILSGS